MTDKIGKTFETSMFLEKLHRDVCVQQTLETESISLIPNWRRFEALTKENSAFAISWRNNFSPIFQNRIKVFCIKKLTEICHRLSGNSDRLTQINKQLCDKEFQRANQVKTSSIFGLLFKLFCKLVTNRTIAVKTK